MKQRTFSAKMLKPFITRNLRGCVVKPTNVRCYSQGIGGNCTKPKGCNMHFNNQRSKEHQLKEPKSPTKEAAKPQFTCCDYDRLKRDPCFQKRELCEKKDLKLDRHVLPLKSVWEYPAECCGNPCPEMLPRFDTLYYCATDKKKREYQQTWVECPPVAIRKRKMCQVDPDELPPLCKRSKTEANRTACPLDGDKLKALCCMDQMKKCPRFKMPHCRSARSPPSCKNPRAPGDCQKRCCPYPAFSECCRPCAKTKPTECNCLEKRMKCEMYGQLRRKLMYDLPPPLPAWPPRQ
ncbi:uncharacterized protein LOC106082746 [Stomoxys calcitrans]|uniref:Uncharacterized protein n=1 Tax=Stomoxys calcitrans TaxID=35570 RepID=A0A1I8QEI3_STOCA|nr:uncharacterized protein LOC106082746 [Stomoxys calcitrans]